MDKIAIYVLVALTGMMVAALAAYFLLTTFFIDQFQDAPVVEDEK